MTTNIPTNQRVYFINGPARGRSMLSPRQPARLNWNDEHGAVHTYRRVTHFRTAHFTATPVENHRAISTTPWAPAPSAIGPSKSRASPTRTG